MVQDNSSVTCSYHAKFVTKQLPIDKLLMNLYFLLYFYVKTVILVIRNNETRLKVSYQHSYCITKLVKDG